MTDDERELQETLKLMHMLASIFAASKGEPLPEPPGLTVQNSADDSPNAPTKAPRFTALKAKLEAQNKSEPSEAVNGISEG